MLLRRAVTIAAAVLALLGLVVALFLVYAHIVYRGDRDASLAAWRSNAVEITGTDRSFVLEPTTGGGGGEGLGLVFIPGAKVEPSAYLFKMSGIVEATGMTVVITRPTLNLAFFDTRPLSEFTADAPDVEQWLVGGHSLGGVRACQLAKAGSGEGEADTSTELSGTGAADPEVVGLMLFGSYCVDDLSASGLAVASFVGSEDGVSTPDDIASRADLLPEDTQTVVLEGSNHALFGDYGAQAGDNEATVTTEEVRAAIAEASAAFVAGIAR